MNCTVGGSAVAHPVNHAVSPPPGEAHCAYYCVPASISMYAAYRGQSGQYVQQDQIYDQGKSTGGDIAGDGVIQTHGIGMFDMGPPNGPADEVAAAFTWAVGAPYKWGPATAGFPTVDSNVLMQCIDNNAPVLWCDHYGWPSNINPEPDIETLDYNGHTKIIAGYDDNNTAIFSDDTFYIYDPWPGSGSPYWVSESVVVDTKDVYYADYSPVSQEIQRWGSIKALFR